MKSILIFFSGLLAGALGMYLYIRPLYQAAADDATHYAEMRRQCMTEYLKR